MTDLSTVLAAAIPSVIPSEAERERVDSVAGELFQKTTKAAAKYPEVQGVLLGGSYAKGTWIPKHVDLDIFVRIDPATSEERFERIGLAIGEAATKGSPRGKKYAQHPYTEATVSGIRANLVPCYAVVDRKWKSAADRSPFHVDLVSGLPDATKIQVRLLKKFMRSVGVYGAEIQTQGFSGYVAEVLVMKHGNFEGVLDSFSSFHPHGEEKIFTLPDPVDESRDLATAISPEKLGLFVLSCRAFLKNPSLAYFRQLSGKARPALRNSVYALVFSHKALSEDTIWGELRKTTKHIVRHLEVRGFKVARAMSASNNKDRSAILLIPEFERLPKSEQRVGPTIDREKDVRAFISSNKKRSELVWVDDDARVRLLMPRDQVNLSILLREVASGKEGHIGASREIAAGMKRRASVLQGPSLAKAANSSEWLKQGISEITTDAIGTS